VELESIAEQKLQQKMKKSISILIQRIRNQPKLWDSMSPKI
ncbi:hypothetical protein EVAR_73203_1, partial [Eumeta japonica]